MTFHDLCTIRLDFGCEELCGRRQPHRANAAQLALGGYDAHSVRVFVQLPEEWGYEMFNGILRFAGIGALVLVAGCGGASSSTSVATTDAGTGGAQTSVVVPTSEATAGGGAAGGVCELVTGEELAEIFGVPSVTTTVIAGPPDNCIVESDAGDPLTAWSLTTAQAKAVFDAFTTDPSTIEVTGIGDEAAIVQNTGLLVLKGGALLVISISGGADLSEEEAIEVSKQIGTIAASRM